jgi:hypothetical protein
MKPRMVREPFFDFATAMDGMLVPHHHNWTWDDSGQMFQKKNNLVATDRLAMGLQMQFEFTLSR